MPTPNNHRRSWSDQETALNKLLAGNTPTRLIAYKLGRTPEAVQSHANRSGKTTKPVNQSPYNRRKK